MDHLLQSLSACAFAEDERRLEALLEGGDGRPPSTLYTEALPRRSSMLLLCRGYYYYYYYYHYYYHYYYYHFITTIIIIIIIIIYTEALPHSRFPKFIVFLLGRDPGTLKSDIVSKRHP